MPLVVELEKVAVWVPLERQAPTTLALWKVAVFPWLQPLSQRKEKRDLSQHIADIHVRILYTMQPGICMGSTFCSKSLMPDENAWMIN